MPKPRSRAGMRASSAPSSRMWPPSGSANPAMSRSSVVLPQPEGPSKQTNSGAVAVKVMSSSARTAPNALRMCSS